MTDKPKFVKPKITKAFEKKVMNDWIESIPNLQIKRKIAFGICRKIGPLLVGISFDIKSGRTEYYPIFGVHNLCNDIDFLTITLYERISKLCPGTSSSITVRGHEAGNYVEAAARMKAQSPIPLEGPVTISQIFNAYDNYIKNNGMLTDECFNDPALLAAWAGRPDLAAKFIDWSCEQVSKYEQYFLKDLPGGLNEWRERLESQCSDPERLRAIAHEQAIFHKVDHLPEEELIIDL